MGRSQIAGWGLFSGERIKTGSFLGVRIIAGMMLMIGIQRRDYWE